MAFAPGHRTDVEPIYLLKREVVELRRCVNPLSVPFQRMQSEHKDLISKEVRRYLRDVADHHSQAAEQIASYDEMLSSLVQAALARVGMQQNHDMRKMAAWTGILAVPTLIAGIYGMNFDWCGVKACHADPARTVYSVHPWDPVGTVNFSNPRAIFAGSPPRFTRSRVTYEAYVVNGTSTRPQVDSASPGTAQLRSVA